MTVLQKFAVSAVPRCGDEVLRRAGLTAADVDLYVFHQADRYMLEHLRKRMKIPTEEFYVAMSHYGNTVSSTIPIALKHAAGQSRLSNESLALLVGYGDYSWGGTLVRWLGPPGELAPG